MKLDFLKNYDFFAGVPDSQLKPLCDYLMDNYGISEKHIIAANEGNCVAMAAGYHLATGKIPVVYLQNSGIGNIINPVASLMNDKVYGIPCIFMIGWRGEPGVKDEPQHVFQGEITIKLLEDMDIKTFIIGKETTEAELNTKLLEFEPLLEKGKSVAFVVRKDAFEFDRSVEYSNSNLMLREDILKRIVAVSEEDIVVSTTGKASRELFEIREANHQSHKYDFLTVGSMGHSSSIALGIALNTPNKKIWCIEGDGAVLMHMGAMALLGSNSPKNMVHVIINNQAHETVGGMPTVAADIDFSRIAEGCGYRQVAVVGNFDELDNAVQAAKQATELSFIEIKCAIGSRDDLGRPTTTVKENKENFMDFLCGL